MVHGASQKLISVEERVLEVEKSVLSRLISLVREKCSTTTNKTAQSTKKSFIETVEVNRKIWLKFKKVNKVWTVWIGMKERSDWTEFATEQSAAAIISWLMCVVAQVGQLGSKTTAENVTVA